MRHKLVSTAHVLAMVPGTVSINACTVDGLSDPRELPDLHELPSQLRPAVLCVTLETQGLTPSRPAVGSMYLLNSELQGARKHYAQ